MRGAVTPMSHPTITFDTNVPALPSVRAFWGTICEEIGQRMVLTPTAAARTVARDRRMLRRGRGCNPFG